MVAASWTISGRERRAPTASIARSAYSRRPIVSRAARPRERATKAERGAGSAAAAPRSGAALDLNTAQFGNAAATGAVLRRLMRDSHPPTDLRHPSADRGIVRCSSVLTLMNRHLPAVH